MRILFIYPNIVESPKDISSGLGILISIAEEKHKVKLIDSSFGVSDSEIAEIVREFNPELVAITSATNDFEYSCHIAKIIKKIKNIRIIMGGFHPTIAPEEAIKRKEIDIICIGEGEEAFSELLESLEKGKINLRIKNLWIKNKNRIIKNPLRDLIVNLDKIPFPDREIFNYEKYLDWNHGTATFITARGCPFQCSYCINHFLGKMYSGKGRYVRFRSINNLFEEIKKTKAIYKDKIKNIEFYDDTFTLDEKRIEEFCKRYKKEINLPFNINARVNAVNKRIFALLKEAGCVRVSIGIESGDENIRNRILKRNMSEADIIQTFREAKEAGLKTYAFNMVGIPFETEASIRKTIELNKKCRPDYIGVSIFNAFKGTEIYDIAKKNKWLRERYSSSYFRDSNIKHPNFSVKRLRRIRNSFGFKVFLAYKPLRAIIDLLDRNFSQINSYIFLRAKLIRILRILR